MKLAELIELGVITIEDLANAPELIDRAKLVNDGLKACNKTLMFPLGATEVACYSYTDSAGEYSAWGHVTWDGIFVCYCNWGGNHEIGRVDLYNPNEVFMAFENSSFAHNLQRFLLEQIEKAKR